LLLFDRVRAAAPKARLVYRMSDDTRNLGMPHSVIEAEERAAPHFHLISAPSRHAAARFAGRARIKWQAHGLDGEVYDSLRPYPFKNNGRVRALSLGSSFFDDGFISQAAKAFPDWDFHILGRVDRLPLRPNVIQHGEVPFEETVAYLQHSDIGLAP